MSGALLYSFPVQRVLGTTRAIVPGGSHIHTETVLARALDRLLSATVDADLAAGVELTTAAAGAREQALEALHLAQEVRNGRS